MHNLMRIEGVNKANFYKYIGLLQSVWHLTYIQADMNFKMKFQLYRLYWAIQRTGLLFCVTRGFFGLKLFKCLDSIVQECPCIIELFWYDLEIWHKFCYTFPTQEWIALQLWSICWRIKAKSLYLTTLYLIPIEVKQGLPHTTRCWCPSSPYSLQKSTRNTQHQIHLTVWKYSWICLCNWDILTELSMDCKLKATG